LSTGSGAEKYAEFSYEVN